MYNKKQAFMQRVASSASRFSNFNGGASNFGPAPQQLSQLDRTLTVNIVNASSAESTYTVFGYNLYGDSATAGQGGGVTVTITESSHAQVKRDMAANPFVLSGSKYLTTTSTNFPLSIVYNRRTSTGSTETKQATPLNYFEPENNQSLLVRINDFNGMVCDGDSFLSGSIAASSTITLLLTIRTKVEISNAGQDQSVVVTTDMPNPTGAQPILMQVSPSSNAVIGIPAPGISSTPVQGVPFNSVPR